MIDVARAGLMKELHCLLDKWGIYRRLIERIAAADKVFAEKEDIAG